MSGLVVDAAIGVLCWFNKMHIRNRAAIAGASQRNDVGFKRCAMAAMLSITGNIGSRNTEHATRASLCAATSAARWDANILCLTFADGRRGAHERNCISKSFISLINFSFQGGFQFLQAITIPARGGIW